MSSRALGQVVPTPGLSVRTTGKFPPIQVPAARASPQDSGAFPGVGSQGLYF